MCDDLWMRRTEERKETSACRIEWKSAFALHDFWLWFMFLAYSHFCEQVAAFEILNGWMNAMQWRKNLINCSIRISNSFTLKTLHKQKLQRYVLLETVEKKRVHTKRGCSRLSKLIQWCDSTLVLRTCDRNSASSSQCSIDFCIFFAENLQWIGAWTPSATVPVPERRYARRGRIDQKIFY